MRLSNAITYWITERRAQGYSAYTLQAKRLQLGLLMRHIGDADIEAFTLETLRGHVAGPVSDGRKPTTMAHRIRMIRSFFTRLVEEGHIGRR